jgi:hypothetical protein
MNRVRELSLTPPFVSFELGGFQMEWEGFLISKKPEVLPPDFIKRLTTSNYEFFVPDRSPSHTLILNSKFIILSQILIIKF